MPGQPGDPSRLDFWDSSSINANESHGIVYTAPPKAHDATGLASQRNLVSLPLSPFVFQNPAGSEVLI